MLPLRVRAFAALTVLLNSFASASTWSCSQLAEAALPSGAQWRQLNCTSTGVPLFGPSGPTVVNVVSADISSPSLRLVPVTAQASAGSLQPIDEMAASSGLNLIAGINAGYFWRIDVSTFTDGVCQGKTRADALENVSAAFPNYGVGDGSIVYDGMLLGSNCNCSGFSRPAILTLNGSAPYISVLHRGDVPPAGLSLDSVSAGPNLVSSNASGPYIDIPSDDDNILNILEHSANTGFGINGSNVYFVTFDGFDSCAPWNPTCGTNAYTLAYFFKDYLGVVTALGMDQGGSTTMFVAGQGNGTGIVSNPGQQPRSVFSGLFLEAVAR